MKLFIAIILLSSTNQLFAQEVGRKVNAFASLQTNKTIADNTLRQNSFGIGLGLQALLNIESRWKPTLEFTHELFGGTKECVIDKNGNCIESKSPITNVLVGASYAPTQRVHFSMTSGISFINDAMRFFAWKPSIYLFSKTQKSVLKISYVNIFQENALGKENLNYLSLGMGVKLF